MKPMCHNPESFIELSGGSQFKHRALDGVTNTPAVYVIRESGSYYVGSTIQLRRRLIQHMKRYCFGEWDAIPTTPATRRSTEQRFIDRFRKRGIEVLNIKTAKARNSPPLIPRVPETILERRQRQRTNKKYRTWITVRGRCRPICFWARKLGVSTEVISMRIKNGWSPVEAATTPRLRRRK